MTTTKYRNRTRLLLLVVGMTVLVSCAHRKVEQLPSHNYSSRIKSLVLHFTAIDYEKSVSALVDEGSVSAHYLIPEMADPSYPRDDITVFQLVDESHRAWHAGRSYWQGRTNLNDSSIGIEIVNVPECQWDDVMPAYSEHGENRLCLFPDYDPKQMQAVIELSQEILARHPDIHPTAVIGHADIAFNRKNDPGPRFPWFQLYQAGVGAWYDNNTLQKYWQLFNQALPSVSLIQSALHNYGYGITETAILDEPTLNAIAAFQMHFVPSQVSGTPDRKTVAALFALLEKYFPAKAQRLLERYQREQISPPPVQAAIKSGQIDNWFLLQERSSRTGVNDRLGFKSYADRGKIRITADEQAEATIVVNGQTLNIASPLRKGVEYSYSLERRTHDGINTLEVQSVTPPEANVKISVPYPVLKDHTAINQHRFAEVDSQIQQDIENGFPGAVLLIIKDGAIIKHTAYGFAKRYDEQGDLLDNPLPMRRDTGFDLASNTKAFATTLAIMQLVEQGKLELNTPVYQILPEYRGDGREARSVEDLLSHQSGYPPSIPYHHPHAGEALFSQDPARTRRLLTTKTPFLVGKQVRASYSDINFMVLGKIIERVTGMPLDQYCEQNIYVPLGLTNTLFTPLRKGQRASEYAATELKGNSRDETISFPNVRTHTLQGEVHDEKAFYSMAGVSGHAGLFSTAGDMAIMMQLLLNGGGYGDIHLFNNSVLQRFTRPAGSDGSFGLGWRLATPYHMRWHFGPYASSSAFGHTGWTGTATVIDPELDLGIVLLTNARHSPIEKNEQGHAEFQGADFETGKYGSIMALIYEAILNTPSS